MLRILQKLYIKRVPLHLVTLVHLYLWQN